MRHKHHQEKVLSIKGDVARVGVARDKLKHSQLSAEALCLTANLARVQDMEKSVPTEVTIQEISSCCNHSIIL